MMSGRGCREPVPCSCHAHGVPFPWGQHFVPASPAACRRLPWESPAGPFHGMACPFSEQQKTPSIVQPSCLLSSGVRDVPYFLRLFPPCLKVNSIHRLRKTSQFLSLLYRNCEILYIRYFIKRLYIIG